MYYRVGRKFTPGGCKLPAQKSGVKFLPFLIGCKHPARKNTVDVQLYFWSGVNFRPGKSGVNFRPSLIGCKIPAHPVYIVIFIFL